MLVYGDAVRVEDPQQVMVGLRHRLETLDAPGPAIERHARLASLFIAAAELAQGLADAAMAAHGGDGPSIQEDAALDFVMVLASRLAESWRTLGETAAPDVELAALQTALAGLEQTRLPAEVKLRTAEGYAYYALYPEAYAAAALQITSSNVHMVIGVRSIGSGLAAVAAAALESHPPITVRPIGPPFQRRLQLQSGLQASLKTGIGVTGRFLIVDEGPGLSGSSFGAVADALEDMGAAASNISFLPGHDGDLGPEASEAHRARWATAERPCVPFDALVLHAEAPLCRLEAWFIDLTQGGTVALQDISGGRWRTLLYADEGAWPAVNAQQERRKFLLKSAAGTWRLKFVGLGATGERAFLQAQALAGAGFTPQAIALRYGFLAEPWLADSRPLQLRPDQRLPFARRVGDYLGWRAEHLRAPDGAGATHYALREMALINAVEALGDHVASAPAFDEARWAAATPPRRVWTDNRLHAHEWLEGADGCWLKTDAVDHAAAHDLVGAQDVAWDVAAARMEFRLDAAETAALLLALRVRAEVDTNLVALLEAAYLAFQLGAYTMAAQAHVGWPEEYTRLARAAAGYRDRLAERLGQADHVATPAP